MRQPSESAATDREGVRRMSGLDAAFLYMETPAHPMHTLKLVVFERTGDRANVDPADALRAGLEARLHLLPRFRRRVLEVPLRVHHPVWIDDEHFELRAHLRQARIHAPGGARELDEVVARIASLPLDRARPLWEIWTLEGSAEGQLIFLLKIHHCVADGSAMASLLDSVMDAAPSADTAARASPPWTPRRAPSAASQLAHALRDHGAQLRALPQLCRTTALRLVALRAHRAPRGLRTSRPVLDTPRTSFNRALTSTRSFASTTLPLRDVRVLKDALGATVNDVVLSLIGGALRDYLSGRGELPTRSLVASVPTAFERARDRDRTTGNRVSSLFTTLATDVEDPVERVRVIHASAEHAKSVQSILGPELLAAWSAYAPPSLLGWVLGRWNATGLANWLPPPINVIVSSVQGPAKTLFVPGYRLSAIYSVGPILEGTGINVTAWSYAGAIHVALLACRDLVPEPHRITNVLAGELEALRAGTTRATARASEQQRPN